MFPEPLWPVMNCLVSKTSRMWPERSSFVTPSSMSTTTARALSARIAPRPSPTGRLTGASPLESTFWKKLESASS